MAACEVCGKVHRIRVRLSDGSVRRIYVCTKCLKAGKVVKAVRVPREG